MWQGLNTEGPLEEFLSQAAAQANTEGPLEEFLSQAAAQANTEGPLEELLSQTAAQAGTVRLHVQLADPVEGVINALIQYMTF